jgi:hypothetical protein
METVADEPNETVNLPNEELARIAKREAMGAWIGLRKTVRKRKVKLITCQFNSEHKVPHKKYFAHAWQCRQKYPDRFDEPIETANLTKGELARKAKMESVTAWLNHVEPTDELAL